MSTVEGTTVYGTAIADNINLSTDNYGAGVVNINGGGGDDVLTGDANDNEIAGGDGLDILSGGDGNDTFLLEGEVNDPAYSYNGGNTTYYTGNVYSGGAGNDVLAANEANLTLVLTDTNQLTFDLIEEINGEGADNFRVSGDAAGNTLDFTDIKLVDVLIDGNVGDDVITGSSANRNGNGASGNDRLEGGYGNDTLVIHGNRADFQIELDTQTNTGFLRISDLIAAGENTGSDVFSGFESIQFDDQTISIAMAAVTDTDGASGAAVQEHLANGAAVGIDVHSSGSAGLASLIGAGLATPTYRFSAGSNPGNIFAIDPVTGIVTVADSSKLDYETATDFGDGTRGYTIYVEATAAGVVSEPVAFRVLVSDGNDPPVFMAEPDGDANPDEVAEGAANGTAVGITAQATDPNGNAVTYSLADDAGGRFAIDPVTGVVTVANGALLDFETQASWAITVRASDGTHFSDKSFTINLTDSAAANWSGTAGNDVFTAPSGEAWALDGGAGDDVIVGNNLADTFIGGEGDDVLVGLAGDDVFLYSGASNGTDQINGGSGYDIIRATAENTVIGISSLNSIEVLDSSGFQNVSIQASAGNDTLDLTNIQINGTVVVHGGDGDDTLIGSASPNDFAGDNGNDVLVGGNSVNTYHYSGTATGFDIVTGGTSYDRIVADADNTVITLDSLSGVEEISTGGFSNVAIQGSSGDNTLDFQNLLMNGAMTIRAGGGADTINSGGTDDTIFGEDGDDFIRGGGGADILNGGNGVDTLSYSGNGGPVNVNLATNAVSGGDATGDTISGFENVVASDSDDVITGSTAANVITGGAGNDTMGGGDGNDTFLIGANSGTDSITGGNGIDTIRFTEDNATLALSTVSTVEIIDASTVVNAQIAGTDTANTLNFSTITLTNIAGLYGLGGNDVITGSTGNNTIIGGAGNDTLSGGNGDDTFRYDGGDEGFDALNGGANSDTVQASTSGVTIGLTSITGVEVISGYGDTIIQGSTAANTLNFSAIAVSGIAMIDGGAGNDVITGSIGDDMIRGGAGNDTLNGGEGNDIFYVNGTAEGTDLYTGGNGHDQLVAQGDNTTIGLGTSISGIELITSQGYANVKISGTTGADVWDFTSTVLDGITSIASGAGIDNITGSGGDDVILGGASGDTLNGGAGIDTLSYAGSATAVTINLGTNTASGGDATGDIISNFENVTGSNGADNLTGNAGDNVLTGGSGNDRLTGGDGFDTLQGDAGNDVFDFNFASESIVGVTTDIVLDFVKGQDKVDFNTIDANQGLAGDQNFAFIGAGAFTNVAGQLRYDDTIGDGYTHIFGDINGDGVADFEVRLQGSYTLASTDFVL